MGTLPRTLLSDWVSSQVSPWDPANAALRAHEAGLTRFIIEDRDLATPPVSCSDGAAYIIAATATDEWLGREGELAIAKGANASNGWIIFDVATEGTILYVKDENIHLIHNGTAWQTKLGALPDAAQTLASSASITPDGDVGLNFDLTLDQAATLENPSNLKVGARGQIRITQDGTGGRTLAYGTWWKFPGGAPTLSVAAGAVDIIDYYVWSSTYIGATINKAFA